MTADTVQGEGGFTFGPAEVALPTGAFAGGGRHLLAHGGRPVAAFTDGAFRPCLHPVWTPSGVVVTAEKPADHPHHSGIWCAADHVGLMMQGPDAIERYDYNFYVDDVFQGRAPGRLVTTGIEFRQTASASGVGTQRIEWRGPREWAAPDGRLVLTETRRTHVTLAEAAHVFDIVSTLEAGPLAVAVGPTRHAFFNARVADSIGLDRQSLPTDDRGKTGGEAIGKSGAALVSFVGPVGHDRSAGITVMPEESGSAGWFVADWGVITVGPVRRQPLSIAAGASASLACRFVAHDGNFDPGMLDGLPPLSDILEDVRS